MLKPLIVVHVPDTSALFQIFTVCTPRPSTISGPTGLCDVGHTAVQTTSHVQVAIKRPEWFAGDLVHTCKVYNVQGRCYVAGRARSLCTRAQLTGKSLQHNTDEYMTLTSGICCTIVDGFRYPMCSDCRCTMHGMSVHMCLISYIRVCLTLAVHLCVCVSV